MRGNIHPTNTTKDYDKTIKSNYIAGEDFPPLGGPENGISSNTGAFPNDAGMKGSYIQEKAFLVIQCRIGVKIQTQFQVKQRQKIQAHN